MRYIAFEPPENANGKVIKVKTENPVYRGKGDKFCSADRNPDHAALSIAHLPQVACSQPPGYLDSSALIAKAELLMPVSLLPLPFSFQAASFSRRRCHNNGRLKNGMRFPRLFIPSPGKFIRVQIQGQYLGSRVVRKKIGHFGQSWGLMIAQLCFIQLSITSKEQNLCSQASVASNQRLSYAIL